MSETTKPVTLCRQCPHCGYIDIFNKAKEVENFSDVRSFCVHCGGAVEPFQVDRSGREYAVLVVAAAEARSKLIVKAALAQGLYVVHLPSKKRCLVMKTNNANTVQYKADAKAEPTLHPYVSMAIVFKGTEQETWNFIRKHSDPLPDHLPL